MPLRQFIDAKLMLYVEKCLRHRTLSHGLMKIYYLCSEFERSDYWPWRGHILL